MPVSSSPNSFALCRMRSPIGMLLLVADDDGKLRAANFEDHAERLHRSLRLIDAAQGGHSLREARTPVQLREPIEAYFDGELDAIGRIKVVTGGTAFQQKVWTALRRISAGKTETYGALAKRIGATRAVRAVGAANGANPISVIVPCHRLIGANGSLIRYGGGLERKHWLLRHEGAIAADA